MIRSLNMKRILMKHVSEIRAKEFSNVSKGKKKKHRKDKKIC